MQKLRIGVGVERTNDPSGKSNGRKGNILLLDPTKRRAQVHWLLEKDGSTLIYQLKSIGYKKWLSVTELTILPEPVSINKCKK